LLSGYAQKTTILSIYSRCMYLIVRLDLKME
jgi:hypothetical protein